MYIMNIKLLKTRQKNLCTHIMYIDFSPYLMKSFHFQKLTSVLYMLMVNMEKELHIKVYERIHHEFNVITFKKYFYCLNISQFQLMDLLNKWYPGCKVYFRVDHVVVKQEGQCFLVMFTFVGKVCYFFI